jgi:hypothetical protein
MRSETAVRTRRKAAAAIEGGNRGVLPQVSPAVVGLAGLEPAPSSLSAIEGSPLCGPAFSEVAPNRQGQSNAFLRLISRLSRAS